jgi:PAS domain S-box-containing protein
MVEIARLKSLFLNVIRSGVSLSYSEKSNRQTMICNITALSVAITTLPFFFIFRGIGVEFWGDLIVPISLAFFSVILLNRYDYFKTANILMYVLSNLIIFTYSFVFGKDVGVHNFFFSVPFSTLLFFKRIDSKGWIAIPAFSCVLYFLIQSTEVGRHSQIVLNSQTLQILNFLFTFITFFFLCVNFLTLKWINIEAEENLRQEQKRQLLHTENTPFGMLEFDSQGKLVRWNSSAEKIFQYSKEDILGKSGSVLFVFDPSEKEGRSQWNDLLRRTESHSYRATNFRKDQGPVHCKWYNTPLFDAKGNFLGVTSLVEDLTRENELESLLNEQKGRMIASAKLSALGEMAAGVAHEINNPLAIIHGKAYQLKERAEAGTIDISWLITAAEKIETTALRISMIIKSLRSLSRNGEQEAFEEVSFEKIVEETLELCRQRFKCHNVDIRISPFAANLSLECQSVQISQVLLNLLNNAYDAVEKLEERWVSLSVNDDGVNLMIMVMDSGHGIPLQIREKMFQPFFTTKDPDRGTGLGLSVSMGIIKAHHGTFRLNPYLENTCFEIILPKVQQKRVTSDLAVILPKEPV